MGAGVPDLRVGTDGRARGRVLPDLRQADPRREPISAPDAVIIQDVALLRQAGVLAGLRPRGLVLINSSRPAESLGLAGHAVPASEIALRHLGRPVPNVALLGAFCALTGAVSLPSLREAIHLMCPRPGGRGRRGRGGGDLRPGEGGRPCSGRL
uniref:Pyruvate:ferredoxin oxidoreductase, gamma subunit n=1 Tax=Nonomuraea gerenzanensis TaxID=93944 RepID=A0A1M4EB98_9ACTN|nr:2-oxoacid:acceptor oxidoreductase family protein [Nonomuraea gerenzanensis]SBO96074.1 Pyruvate:ferredoxin oxidoreductase, gamma subunit [Nonomuraea gerenzanensis]